LKIQTTQAKKHFGQNFLTNKDVLNKIIENSQIQKEDFVLEIGPGTANLTQLINQKTDKYLGLEIDESLMPFLNDYNVKFEDSLNFDIRNLPDKYKLIANIPYYITSPILNHYLMQSYINSWPMPEFMILMVQKEFAEKLTTSKKSNLLQSSISCVADVEYLFTVPSKDFDPAPKVDSAIIKITPNPKIPKDMEFKKFWSFLKILYSNPRKTIKNNLKPLKKDLNLISDETLKKRPEDLDLHQSLELFMNLK